jgi:hypothetical protein
MSVATIGRTVHLLGCPAHPNEPAAAVITRAWSTRDTAEGAVGVNLTVFPDGAPPLTLSSVMLFEDEQSARAYRFGSAGMQQQPAAFWPPRA